MTKWHPTALKRQETFKRKMAYFRQLGHVNIMKGCEWSKTKKSIQPPTLLFRPGWAHGANFVWGGVILGAEHNGGNHFRRIRIYRISQADPVFEWPTENPP